MKIICEIYLYFNFPSFFFTSTFPLYFLFYRFSLAFLETKHSLGNMKDRDKYL